MFDGDILVFEASVCTACAEVELAEEESVERDRRVTNLLAKAGGGRLRALSLDTYPRDCPEDDRVSTAAINWMHDESVPTLFMFGPVGAGKTGLAWGIVREACEREIPAALVNFRDYLAGLKLAFNLGEPPDRLPHTIPLLAIDDLGAERPTEWARDELATLIEERYRNRRRTIVTSNYTPTELARRLGHDDLVIGQRIVSRIVDGAMQIRFTGPDRRIAA